MHNVMVDLETMSISPGAAIVSIGAVEFDYDLEEIVSKFYCNISLQSCLDKGLKIDGSTVEWWLSQDKQAKSGLKKDRKLLKTALQEFIDWFPKGNVQVWGNGAPFDNVILRNAFSVFNAEAPWPFYMDRCFRTVKASYDTFEIDCEGVHHNALDDAIWQAYYLMELVKRNKIKNML